MYKLLLVSLVCLAMTSCSTRSITPTPGPIDPQSITLTDLTGVRVLIENNSKKEVYRNRGGAFERTYTVDTVTLGNQYIKLLKHELSRLGASTGGVPNRSLIVDIYDIEYLGAGSLSFDGFARIGFLLTLGNGGRFKLNATYRTEKSLSSGSTYFIKAFNGVIRDAVVITLNHKAIQGYLLAAK